MQQAPIIHIANPASWQAIGGSWVRGHAWCQGRLLRATELAGLLAGRGRGLLDELFNHHGFYCLIHDDGAGTVCAAVDHLRSIPLFYAVVGNGLVISDDVNWVLKQAGGGARDPVTEAEFEILGYVTGQETLYPGVRQLQPGEYLIARHTVSGIELATHKYYRFKYEAGVDPGEAGLTSAMAEAVRGMVNRLCEYAGGRCLALPLSGGLDSRLLALALKEQGYPDVLTFTYGRPRNNESVLSRDVARRLGLRWEFVEYSEGRWRDWTRSPEWHRFMQFASGQCSVPHVQDWPAVWDMRQRGVLPPGTVFIPGLIGGIQAGSTYSRLEELVDHPADDFNAIAAQLLKVHYNLCDWRAGRPELEQVFLERIRQLLGDLRQYPNAVSAAAAFYMDNRIAKFLVNSVRVYEFWGYDWWLPYGDRAYMDFMAGVPYYYRRGKWFYSDYVGRSYAAATGVSLALATRTEVDNWIDRLAARARERFGSSLALRCAYFQVKRLLEYRRNCLAWYGIMPRGFFKRNFTGHEHFNWFMAQDYLGHFDLAAGRDLR